MNLQVDRRSLLQWHRKLFLERKAGKRSCGAGDHYFMQGMENFLGQLFKHNYEEPALVASHYMLLHVHYYP